MSRFKHFTQALVSGYSALAANIVYTFASVPIALHFLSPAEFGVWALVMQILGYIALIDMGMSGSVSRLLIDHKDDKASGQYGSIIKTGALVGAVQALIVLGAGAGLAYPLALILKVPEAAQSQLIWLLIGQSALTAFNFATRIYFQILVAHQRNDIPNHGLTVGFLLSIPGMWLGFKMGWGVYSWLVVQAGSALLIFAVNYLGCLKLNLLPGAGQWGRATWPQFKELFSYGRDLFLYSIGMQFIQASQTILLTRFMGLDAAAVWSICTRLFTMFGMLISKIHEYTGPPLAEMYVRGENDRMRDRLRDVAFITTNLSIVAATILAVCNSLFVQLWTQGRIQWDPLNDLLIAIYLVASMTMRAHISLAGALKRFGFLCYVILFEGVLFLGLNILLRNFDGISRMLLISILCVCSLSLPYILWRSRRYFGLTWSEIAKWYESSWQLFWRLLVVIVPVWFLTRELTPTLRLAANAAITGLVGGLFLLRYGLGQSLRNDLAGRLPTPLKRIFLRMNPT